MTAAASPPDCNESEAEAYARIGAAIDFIYRTSEDVWTRQVRHTLRVSKVWTKLNGKNANQEIRSTDRPAAVS